MARHLFLHSMILLLVATSTLIPGSSVYAALAPDDTLAMETAARQRVAQNAPGVAVERVELSRVVDDYAIATVYPERGVTDPAGVILKKQAGAWTAVAGPGTGFPPGSRGGAPDELFDFGPVTATP